MTIKKGGKTMRIYEPLAGEEISEIAQNMVTLEGRRAIRREEAIDSDERWEASPECRRQRAIREGQKAERRREMLNESIGGREYDENP
ncbi:hypothetical protein KKF60_02020 [Patescibacteria group bacterium]|nr:hypothetical protein [Patescibacteria group bacterium]MBU4458648.1 hypothetical protein [Patescibacteria group bacterium]MCG2696007.1 hypothetical protein [Candidatus Portnoybacteria bacterium]MCG2808773.1 hypothetical protein [Candidatus Portnoybacteria bacterium]